MSLQARISFPLSVHCFSDYFFTPTQWYCRACLLFQAVGVIGVSSVSNHSSSQRQNHIKTDTTANGFTPMPSSCIFCLPSGAPHSRLLLISCSPPPPLLLLHFEQPSPPPFLPPILTPLLSLSPAHLLSLPSAPWWLKAINVAQPYQQAAYGTSPAAPIHSLPLQCLLPTSLWWCVVAASSPKPGSNRGD